MKEFKLGEIAESFQNGIGKGISFYGRGVKVANIGDLYEFPVFQPVKFSLLEVDEKEKERYLLKTGDLLFVRSSLKREGVAFCSTYDSTEECLFSSFMIRVRLDKSICDPKYVSYILRGDVCRERLINASNTSTITNINQEGLASVEIPLPPLSTQKKIAAILDAADLYRQKTKTLVAKYDQLAQSLFLEMFGDPVSNPKCWEKTDMNKLCSFKKESILPENIKKSTKYIGLESIEKETGNILDINEVTEGELKSNKFVFDENYILYGKLRPYLNKVALPNFNGICSTDIIPIKPIKDKSNRQFICQIMRSKGFVSFAHERSSGANLPRISPNEIEKYPIINPPISLQTQFASRIQLIEAQKQQALAALQKSETLFNSLLQRAFKGELVAE